jgi:putative ABC transport system permease protein
VRSDKALVGGEEAGVTGIDPATIGRFYSFAWERGSGGALARLGTDGALVTRDYAKEHGIAVGQRLAIRSPSGATLAAVVRGVYDPPKAKPLLDEVSISQAAFDATFPSVKDAYTFLDAGPGARAGLEAVVADSGDAALHLGADYAHDATKDTQTVMAMLYVLLAFSVVVSLFGMVNTLVLSVFERTRELGLLRVVGMSRRQVRRMVRWESVVIAVLGGIVGLALGMLWGWAFARALEEQGITVFRIPWLEVLLFVGGSMIAGVLAAVFPAWRASRLDVLDAIATE